MKDKYHLIIAIPLDVQESSSEKESSGIQSKPATRKYEDGWTRIFGKDSNQTKTAGSDLPN